MREQGVGLQPEALAGQPPEAFSHSIKVYKVIGKGCMAVPASKTNSDKNFGNSPRVLIQECSDHRISKSTKARKGKVRLHRYNRLQGHLSGSTEACNQTWPKMLDSKNLDWEEEIACKEMIIVSVWKPGKTHTPQSNCNRREHVPRPGIQHPHLSQMCEPSSQLQDSTFKQ
eukprot:1154238-Pelagomonas_calceolata.AAC.3